MNKKNKVLVFVDWYLPGYKAGGPITSVSNLINNLKGECQFSVVTRNTDYCDSTPYKGIDSDTWILGADTVRIYYFSKRKMNIFSVIKLIREEQFDYLYLNGLYSKYFTIVPLLFCAIPKKNIILAPRGMLSDGAINIKRIKKRWFIGLAKITNLFKDVIFQASTEEEKRQIKFHLGANSQVFLAPNLPKPISIHQGSRKVASKIKGKIALSIVARIAPEKNLLYALNLLPKIKGDIIFNIYGTVYDPDYWAECNKVINMLPRNIIVQFHNSISPNLLTKAILDTDFLLLPTTGENFGHVIWESLSAGTPVIISNTTPWRELKKACVGWDISLKDPEMFIDVLNRCIQMEDDQYQKMSCAALDYCRLYLNNSDSLERNKQLFGIS